jgi:hypothetical protein
MTQDDRLKDLTLEQREFIKRIINEKEAENEYLEKHGEPKGIEWCRTRTIDNRETILDFNTFFNEQIKEYQNELLVNKQGLSDCILVERHNLQRRTTRYNYYPTAEQSDEVESYLHIQRINDNPDYYIEIHHALVGPPTNNEMIIFIGCRKGKWIGRTEAFIVDRYVKHHLGSNVKGFRQTKFPWKKNRWSRTDPMV